nr:RNA methyltransferase [Chloroherpeton thalassium]
MAEGLRTVTELLSACNAEDDLVAIVVKVPIDNDLKKPDCNAGKVFVAEKSDFETISATEQTQGVVGIFRQPKADEASVFQQLEEKKTALVLIWDGIQDPGNAGTMIRTAAWFGADAIFASHDSVDFFNPKVVRASAGSLFALPLIKSASLGFVVDELKQKRLTVYASSPAGTSIWEVSKPKKTALIIGSEANGVTSALFLKTDQQITIPGNSSAVESLNAAISAGILTAAFMPH